ncbi:hypothetical protein O3M35_006381 [Rhynocoris fuscipes]|uniref:Mitochondrial dicarboxylate carrier n=1 Tax=Rhynocoris fuscipes TaxID=488301 RepID=A0AAW1DEW7_9HEMI
MSDKAPTQKRVQKWYFGGLASAGAVCVTHPLDLLKVLMQTQQEKKVSLITFTKTVVKNNGIFGLYNGLSASLMRQLTYSTTRFALYEGIKDYLAPAGQKITFPNMLLAAGLAGGIGGYIGAPADLVNVRMQNDMKLPPEKRRNYKHALHGLWRVINDEGFIKIFNGSTTTACRAAMMTIGQLASYDVIKAFLLKLDAFDDNPITHFTASVGAGGVATFLTQPLDVIKTRIMNAKPGEFKGVLDVVNYTAKLGPLGFFAGFVPAFARLAPQTILVFLFLEQLTQHFGTVVKP